MDRIIEIDKTIIGTYQGRPVLVYQSKRFWNGEKNIRKYYYRDHLGQLTEIEEQLFNEMKFTRL